jgi:uncharacterized protein YbaP (TraB family)
MKKRVARFLSVFVVLCLLTSSACLEHAFSQSPKTFLWRVRSKTTTVYVLGSLHFFKKEFYPLNKKIDDAFDQSQVLVVEANINEPDKLDVQKLKKEAFYVGDDHLEKHVSPETYDLIKKEAVRVGIPLDAINKQKPWFLALALEALELMKLGFDPRYGIDVSFLSKATDKKKILELEGLDYQFNLLSRLSDKEQELFLVYTLKDLSTIGQEIDNYVRTWTSGDIKGMESLIIKGMTEDVKASSIPEKFFYERNKNMVSKIEDLLKTKETTFVIVGAGHLVGSKGIIEMLTGKGYLVEQL